MIKGVSRRELILAGGAGFGPEELAICALFASKSLMIVTALITIIAGLYC
jgi:hypothetical protein